MILVLSKIEIWTEWLDPHRSIEDSDMEFMGDKRFWTVQNINTGGKKDGNRGSQLAHSNYKHPETV